MSSKPRPIAFVIMHIGTSELDKVYEDAFAPALKECGFEPKRVDKHNKGGLLRSEIDNFIQSSAFIIADLTNERPNCYLEVGYAMGLDKLGSLILTARKDHAQDSPNHKQDGPKIHFDLAGHDILFWDGSELGLLKTELVRRIQRRKALLADAAVQPRRSPLGSPWFDEQRKTSLAGLEAIGRRGFMEIRLALLDYPCEFKQTDLLDAARKAQLHGTGWPLWFVANEGVDFRPKPRSDGVSAVISEKGGLSGTSYDFWYIRKDGTCYLLRDLKEDAVGPGSELVLSLNQRIALVTEALLYARRLYYALEIPPTTSVLLETRYGGLRGRALALDLMWDISSRPKSTEDEASSRIESPLKEIEPKLNELVQALVSPLCIIFDFYRLDVSNTRAIVDAFVKRVSE